MLIKNISYPQVVNRVQTLIVPVLVILQNRVDAQQRNHQQAHVGIDAQTLEEVRNDWCALVGDSETTNEASAVVTEIIPIVLLDASAASSSASQGVTSSKNRDSVNLTVDLTLANRYVDVVGQIQRFGTYSRATLNEGQPERPAAGSTPQPPSSSQLEP